MRSVAFSLLLGLIACGSSGSSGTSSGGGSTGGGTGGFDGAALGPDGGTLSCHSNGDCSSFNDQYPPCRDSCVDDSVVCSNGLCQCQRENLGGGQSCYLDCDCQSGACPGATGNTPGICCPSKGSAASGAACHSPCECASATCQSNGFCL